MNAPCEALRPALELYAEGELRDPRRLARVRHHLDACALCRQRLAAYDAATATVLAALAGEEATEDAAEWAEPLGLPEAAAAARAERRQERILARIDASPPPRTARPPRSRQATVALLELAAPAAVLAAAAALLAALLLLPGRGPSSSPAGRPAAEPLAGAQASRAASDGSLARAPGGATDLARVRWWRQEAGDRPPPGRVFWLRGAARGPGAPPGFVLEVRAVRAGERDAPRLLLVPEADDAALLWADPRLRSRAASAPAGAWLEVVPRRLVELTGLSEARAREIAPRYRAVPVGVRPVVHGGTSLEPAPGGPAAWLDLGSGARSRIVRPESASLLEGPRS